FILDEMRTGFRLALGGAQEYFSVRADLATFSKALANGYSISAVVGPSAVMATLKSISLSSLFFRSTDGFAAALATLEILSTTDAIPRIWHLGQRLLDGLRQAADSEDVPAHPIGLA